MHEVHYNGWPGKTKDKAWALWNVALWIGNDEGLYRTHRAWLRNWKGRGPFADDAEAFCREMFPGGTPDMASAREMNGVNWAYLASNWRQEKKELCS
jgi:hypothetical protein